MEIVPPFGNALTSRSYQTASWSGCGGLVIVGMNVAVGLLGVRNTTVTGKGGPYPDCGVATAKKHEMPDPHVHGWHDPL